MIRRSEKEKENVVVHQPTIGALELAGCLIEIQ
jgi:hypothetical protein